MDSVDEPPPYSCLRTYRVSYREHRWVRFRERRDRRIRKNRLFHRHSGRWLKTDT
jgi:hypothetical protein